jgi:hypothetical protein
MKESAEYLQQIDELERQISDSIREHLKRFKGEFIPEDHGVDIVDSSENIVVKITDAKVICMGGVDYPLENLGTSDLCYYLGEIECINP